MSDEEIWSAAFASWLQRAKWRAEDGWQEQVMAECVLVADATVAAHRERWPEASGGVGYSKDAAVSFGANARINFEALDKQVAALETSLRLDAARALRALSEHLKSGGSVDWNWQVPPRA